MVTVTVDLPPSTGSGAGAEPAAIARMANIGRGGGELFLPTLTSRIV